MVREGRVTGKVAIVTGAASGIGLATARALAREDASVMLADINTAGGELAAESIRQAGGSALFQYTDVGDPQSLRALVERSIGEYGHLEIVFNNAAIKPPGTVLDTPLEVWDHTMIVNLRSVFYLTQLAAQAMLNGALAENVVGSIINAASPTGMLGYPNNLAYATSKGGIAAMTRCMAMELAPRVRVNSVVPGTINTGILQNYLAGVTDPQHAMEAFIQQHPVGRIGEPEDVALAVLYLASDESAFVTGSALVVDGGLMIAKGNPT
ncbi:MAG: SDR family oxidoreductase [Chloroflexota bacterium]|nr:SDR family oxidoreductase [Chloroflexota bacterium]